MLRKLSAIIVKRATPFIWYERTPENLNTLSLVQSSINLGIVVLMTVGLLYIKPFQCNECRLELINFIEARTGGGNRGALLDFIQREASIVGGLSARAKHGKFIRHIYIEKIFDLCNSG